MVDSSYKTKKRWYLPKFCGNCGNSLNEMDENMDIISRRIGIHCRHCGIVNWAYLSSEHKEKSQIPNTDGNDRTDIVKSSQPGFEVPEV